MDESAPEYQSPNFIFRFPPNSLAEKHIHLIANRMQSVLDEALKVLNLALPHERIQVYLSEMEEVELHDEIQEDGGSSKAALEAIRSVYRWDGRGQRHGRQAGHGKQRRRFEVVQQPPTGGDVPGGVDRQTDPEPPERNGHSARLPHFR